MKTLIRLDLNVPIKNGKITDDTRIQNYTQSIRKLVESKQKIAIFSHLGRPKKYEEELSTKILIPSLETNWKYKIVFCESYDPKTIDTYLANLNESEILLLENTRFYEWEKSNDEVFAKSLAKSFDQYILDAFSSSHRKHLSTSAITKFLPSKIGDTCSKEITELTKALSKSKPVIIMGGAKAQTKLKLIETLLPSADKILIGGVLANTFLKAQGFKIGNSLYEEELIKHCQSLLQNKESNKIILPFDFKTATTLEDKITRDTEIIKSDELIGDIGPKTTEKYLEIIQKAENIIFNGPTGYLENTEFAKSSMDIIRSIKERPYSCLGGGDTLKLLKKSQLKKSDFSYVSMAGGAMLEFLANNGKLEVLENIK